MESHDTDPILLVCADEERAFEILGKLYDEGFTTVGSAPSAWTALTLAAQTMPAIAILVGSPNGRRGAEELARELTRVWGVACFTMASGPEVQQLAGDEVLTGIAAALQEALGDVRLRPAQLQ